MALLGGTIRLRRSSGPQMNVPHGTVVVRIGREVDVSSQARLPDQCYAQLSMPTTS
jgi:hypothetical protein